MNKVHVSLLLLAAIGCFMTQTASAMYHVVGGSLGWTIPPNQTYFQDWVKTRTIGVEDKLLFPYRIALHNVLEVSKEDFEACTQKNLFNTYYKGPTILNFTRPGDYYYYSGIGTQCEAGQKLHVTVVNGKGSSGRASVSPAPSPTPTPTPPSSGASHVGSFVILSGLVPFVVSLFF